jgi:fatty acid CoA ligase FadD36
LTGVPADLEPLLTELESGVEDRDRQFEIDGESISRSQLLEAASAVARRIEGAGAVGVRAVVSLPTAVGVVAGILAGVPVVPIPPDAGGSEGERMLADAGVRLLLHGGDGASELPSSIEQLAVDPRERAAPFHRPVSPDSPALVVYTSGTTGPAKGAVISRRAVAADLDALASVWGWTADDVLVHGLPLFHVHGLVLGLLGPLRIGSRLVHTGRPTASAYAAAEGSLYFGVPTIWSRICEDAAAASELRSARLLVSGSAPLSGAVFDRLTGLVGSPPLERYGMTESLITYSTRVDGERRRGSVGLPLPGVEARVVDEQGVELDVGGGETGELLVRGPTVFDGYVGRPAATAEMFTTDGWLRTGDMACTDGDGYLRIAGRSGVDLFKVGGYRVGAGEIEDALASHPAVREVAVVAEPDDDLGQVPVAYVVADGVDEALLIEHVASRLAWHKRPRRVAFVERLPRNAMGKVRKDLLHDR